MSQLQGNAEILHKRMQALQEEFITMYPPGDVEDALASEENARIAKMRQDFHTRLQSEVRLPEWKEGVIGQLIQDYGEARFIQYLHECIATGHTNIYEGIRNDQAPTLSPEAVKLGEKAEQQAEETRYTLETALAGMEKMQAVCEHNGMKSYQKIEPLRLVDDAVHLACDHVGIKIFEKYRWPRPGYEMFQGRAKKILERFEDINPESDEVLALSLGDKLREIYALLQKQIKVELREPGLIRGETGEQVQAYVQVRSIDMLYKALHGGKIKGISSVEIPPTGSDESATQLSEDAASDAMTMRSALALNLALRFPQFDESALAGRPPIQRIEDALARACEKVGIQAEIIR